MKKPYKEKVSTNSEMLDLPHINNDLQSKRFQTAIPSYQELCNISPNTSNVPMLSTDIFFLKYLDGLHS